MYNIDVPRGSGKLPKGQQVQGLHESRPTLLHLLDLEKGGGRVIQITVSVKVDSKACKEVNQSKELEELKKAIEIIAKALTDSKK